MFRFTQSLQRTLSRNVERKASLLKSTVAVRHRKELPEFHPKDLRYYFLTEDELFAVQKMDNLADIPFDLDDFPGFNSAPNAATEYYFMKEEWIEYLMQKVHDMEDPGPVLDPYARFNRLPDPDTESDAVISAINGVVVDLKLKPDVHCAIWDAFEVRGTEHRIVMEVACWEGDRLVRCITMEDTFDLFPGMELTWLRGPISVPVGTQVSDAS
jgi:hypothetical protein